MNGINGNGLDRREFIKRLSVLGMGAGILATLAGCESDDNADDSGQTNAPASSGYSNRSASIGSNHGHSATLSASQQAAGNAVTLSLSSGGGHTHSVSFSASQVQTIADGGSASSQSSNNAGHSHSVSFS
jgi:hypothetical protein